MGVVCHAGMVATSRMVRPWRGLGARPSAAWGAALLAPHRSGGLARFARSWAGRFSARWAPPSAAWARRYRGACPTSERKRASPSASEASAPYGAKHRPTSGRKRASPSASEASAPYGAKHRPTSERSERAHRAKRGPTRCEAARPTAPQAPPTRARLPASDAAAGSVEAARHVAHRHDDVGVVAGEELKQIDSRSTANRAT